MKTISLRPLPWMASVALLALACAPARAALIVSTTNTVASQGSTGYFEVLLTNDDSFDRTLSAFSLDVSVGAGVEITAVDDATSTAAYVFGSDGTGDLVLDSLPAGAVNISDLDLFGIATIEAGHTVGLARIAYAVDANAAIGPVLLSFTPGDGTRFLSGSGVAYPSTVLSLEPGTFQVTAGGVPTVPEPASLICLALGLAGVGARSLGLGARSRRAA